MKKIIFFIILILIFIAVPITVYVVGQQQELRSKAAPATVLALNPSQITKKPGDVFSFDVQIDTGGNNVAMAELHLTYDATQIEALSITNGPLAPKIAASGVVGGGTASITVRAESTAQPIKGTGTIAIVRFRALAGTSPSTQIKFDTTTYVSGLGESKPNVLVNTIPATVTISGGTQTQSSTPTITPTQGAQPSITPIPTLIPSIAPTEEATTSSEASDSAIQIIIQTDESGVAPNTPLIQGKAAPGSTVTIVIHSDDPITAVVTADENGNWQYTPSQTLADGSHTVVVTSQDPNGATTSTSSAFEVSSTVSSELTDEMPTSGTLTYTVLLLGIGCSFLLGGMVIAKYHEIV